MTAARADLEKVSTQSNIIENEKKPFQTYTPVFVIYNQSVKTTVRFYIEYYCAKFSISFTKIRTNVLVLEWPSCIQYSKYLRDFSSLPASTGLGYSSFYYTAWCRRLYRLMSNKRLQRTDDVLDNILCEDGWVLWVLCKNRPRKLW